MGSAPYFQISGALMILVAIAMVIAICNYLNYAKIGFLMFKWHFALQMCLLVFFLINDGWSRNGDYLWMLVAPFFSQILALSATISIWSKKCEGVKTDSKRAKTDPVWLDPNRDPTKDIGWTE